MTNATLNTVENTTTPPESTPHRTSSAKRRRSVQLLFASILALTLALQATTASASAARRACYQSQEMKFNISHKGKWRDHDGSKATIRLSASEHGGTRDRYYVRAEVRDNRPGWKLDPKYKSDWVACDSQKPCYASVRLRSGWDDTEVRWHYEFRGHYYGTPPYEGSVKLCMS